VALSVPPLSRAVVTAVLDDEDGDVLGDGAGSVEGDEEEAGGADDGEVDGDGEEDGDGEAAGDEAPDPLTTCCPATRWPGAISTAATRTRVRVPTDGGAVCGVGAACPLTLPAAGWPCVADDGT
jgi:hypothetical protein